MTYKLILLYDRLGWAYHRRVTALKKYAPAGWDVRLALGNERKFPEETCDLYLQPSYNCTGRLRHHVTQQGSGAVIVTNFTTGWEREGPSEGRDRWPAFYDQADWIVFNSRAAWGLANRPPRTSWISNGVDRDIFKVVIPPADRKPKVLWCGSFFHTQENKKDLKNYFSLLMPLKERLAKRGIVCDYRRVDSSTMGVPGNESYTTEQMVEWYNTGTVYVCASDSEGTPNPALEAASCGCILVSPPVGNMPELIQHGLNGLLAERSVDDLEAGVLQAVENYQTWQPAMEEAIHPWHWRSRAAEYYALFKWLLEGRRK